MDYGIGGIGSSPASVSPSTIRPTEQNSTQLLRNRAPDEQSSRPSATSQQTQTLNTAPTEQERDTAVSAGRTRGNFVDIQA
ncbi:MAG: hypothetical protein RLY86_3651 [Pseudomonadota bacterium]|jgi:hypothetical protein